MTAEANKQSRSQELGFEPSTGEEDYLKTTAEKKELAKSTLSELKVAINSTYATGISFAQKATVEMIKCGNYLCEAREQFTSDEKFGQWRKKNVEFSQSHAARLMGVAREFGENEDALLLPIGTLAELLPASDTLKKEVIQEAKDGNKPTRAEVTKRKKEEKESSSPEGETKVASKSVRADKSTKPARTLEPWQIAQEVLFLPFAERLMLIDPRGSDADPIYQANLIFGIPPYHDGQPSLDLVHTLYHGYIDDVDDPDLEDRFLVAYDTLTGLY